MKNPVVLASGTCGFGRELAEYFDLGGLGGICSKGLTLHARDGNTGTRVWETPSGLMNSIGLENPGVQGFIDRELDWMNGLGTAVIVNLGGHCIDDYIEGISLLNDAAFDLLELNISCPNVRQGGMNFGVRTDVAREVVRAARKACRHRMTVKLSPNAEDIVSLARMCEDEGADGVSLVNTFLGMAVDVFKRRPVFDNCYAGLSGPAIRPVALRMAHQVARAVKIPVMALGGIATWRDAVEFVMAGATAVQIGTATLVKPDAAVEIADGIARFMDEQKIGALEEIRGIV
jgi:dihydroorotate dehydrogenase (NAD+) catalytic subunit